MTKEEFKPIARTMRMAYRRDSFLDDPYMLDEWLRLLEDLDAKHVRKSVDEYVRNNEYQPTIADIRKGCEKILEKESGLRLEMREAFDLAKGVYPCSRIEKDTMAYWNRLTAGDTWEERVQKAKTLTANIVSYVRDAELKGNINNIPSFTGCLRGLADEL